MNLNMQTVYLLSYQVFFKIPHVILCILYTHSSSPVYVIKYFKVDPIFTL